MKSAVVLYNPTSGTRKGVRAAEAVSVGLTNAQWELTRVPTKRAGHALDLAAEWGARVDLVVVVGGDGTVREAAFGLLAGGHSTPLAVIPQGTGNVIAREIGIPLGMQAAVDGLNQGVTRELDALLVNGELVLAMVGLGIDARIVRRIDWARRCWGLRGWYRMQADSLYIGVGLSGLLGSYKSTFRATCDGRLIGSGFRHGAVSNTRTYGKGMTLSPEADANDGLLDYALRQRSGFVPSFRTLLCAQRCLAPPSSLVLAGQGKHMLLEAEGRPLEWQVDGDSRAPVESLDIQLLPGALKLWAPAT
jgi:diacylglycerol kinase (ATP)